MQALGQELLRGTTVGMSVDFLSAARSQDLTATARVLRRGSSLCFCEVEVAGGDGRLVAKALVTYKLG
jgi:acyl-coenzyme A thioesterase PaaI-like protein